MSDDLTLYGITKEMNQLEDLLFQSEGEVTQEVEEVQDKIQELLIHKVDGCAGYIEKQKDLIAIAKEKKKELDKFIKTKENAIESFSNYVKFCLQRTGKEKFTGLRREIYLRKPQKKVEILDQEKLPIQFIEIEKKVKVKTAEIKKALKEGKVEGAKLVDGKISVVFGGIK